MKRIAVLVVLAGTAAQAGPSPWVSSMFEDKHVMRYAVTVDGKTAPDLTCTVTKVAVRPGGTNAKIECDRELDPDYGLRPDGVWSATRTAIRRVTDLDDAEVVDDVLALPPKARTTRTRDGLGGYVVHRVWSPAADTYCRQVDTTHVEAGDGAIEEICFKKGAGLASGRLDYRGGEPRVIAYRLK